MRSLLSKIDQIKLMLIDEDIDILCLTETWLVPCMDSNFIQIEGYELFRKDRGSRGGGACIYAKTEYITRTLKTVGNGDEVDDVWITVQVRKTKSFIVGAIYRPPKASNQSFSYIESNLQIAANSKKNMYVLGDLNDNQLKPNKVGPIIKKLKLEQLIEEPTRTTKDSSSLLDLIITNNRSSVLSTNVCESLADHKEISCLINVRKEKRKPVILTYRTKENYSKDLLKQELWNRVPLLNNMRNTDDVNIQSTIFVDTFSAALDTVAPIVTKKLTRPPISWMTPVLNEEMKTVKYFHRGLKCQAKKNDDKINTDANCSVLTDEQRVSNVLKAVYKSMKNRVEKLTGKAKREAHLADLKKAKNNPKQTWNILGNIVPHKKPQKAFIYENPVETAEAFNDFFANVGKHTYDEVMIEHNKTSSAALETPVMHKSTRLTVPSHNNPLLKNKPMWSPSPVSRLEIVSAIYALKNTNSCGDDGIALQYLKDGLEIVLPYLQLLINTSIATNTFPQNWKHALIKAIHKKGEVNDPSNHRPISLLPVTSKILEKIIARQLLDYLEEANLINDCQYAYRRKTSTEDALLKISELVYKAIDQNNLSLLVLLDLSKAFDSVNHDILLKKLLQLNIQTSWFESYLRCRSQSVVLDGKTTSSPKPVNFGVPQGSILGPVLFLLFINDINCGNPFDNARMTLYADDVQLLFVRPAGELEKLKNDAEIALTHIKDWYSSNGLKVNANKTQCIILGSKANTRRVPENFVVDCMDAKIPLDNRVKSLGVWFDPNMTFEHHVGMLCSKLNGTLMFLSKTKRQLDFKSRLLVINALIFSHLNYCPTIWGKCKKTLLSDIQRSINFTAKVAHDGNFRKSDHVTPILKKLGWLNIHERLELSEAIKVFKIQNKLSCSNGVALSTRKAAHQRSTRNDNNIDTEFRRTKAGAKAFTISGPKCFNNLPADIQNCATVASFKQKCTSLLLARRQELTE